MAYVKEAAMLSMIGLQREYYSAIKDKIISFEGKMVGTVEHHVKGNKLDPAYYLMQLIHAIRKINGKTNSVDPTTIKISLGGDYMENSPSLTMKPQLKDRGLQAPNWH